MHNYSNEEGGDMYFIDSVIHDLRHQDHTDDDDTGAQWSARGFLDQFKYAGIDH